MTRTLPGEPRGPRQRRVCAWWVALAASTTCAAGDLSVSVFDPAGRAVSEVVVTVTALQPHAASSPGAAVMDQRRLEFTPRVLVVATGTSVEFPNNDTVSHQVYSFSAPKKFQLPLYKGQKHSPVTFGAAGLVVLGCNIHDEMVGYIYVTDAPYFGKTDAAGSLRFAGLPAGEYQLTFWSPYIADPAASLTRGVRVDAHDATASHIQLTHALRALPEPRPRRADWEY